jgi:hypothetical protein
MDVVREVEDRRLTLAERTHHLKTLGCRVGCLHRPVPWPARIAGAALPECPRFAVELCELHRNLLRVGCELALVGLACVPCLVVGRP